MLLTAKLVDEVHYNERGNEVFLVKHLDKLEQRPQDPGQGGQEARVTIQRENSADVQKVGDHA